MAESVQQSTVLDSIQQQVGRVYAKALYQAAENAGIIDQVVEEFAEFEAEVLNALPDFAAVMIAPRIPLDNKLAFLDQVTVGRVSDTFRNFLKVVVRHRRFDCVRGIRAALVKLKNELDGRADVTLVTAEALPEELRASTVARLEAALGRKINLTVEIDDQLLGGMVVRMGDTVYDGSVLGRLERLREVVVERASHFISESSERFEQS